MRRLTFVSLVAALAFSATAHASLTPAQKMCRTWAAKFNALSAKHKSPLYVEGFEARPYAATLTWCSMLLVDAQTNAHACYLALVDTSARTWNVSNGRIPKTDCAHPWKKAIPIA